MIVWRSPTGFIHNGSAADVVRYEQNKNDLGITPEFISKLEHLHATRLMWVSLTKEAASRYGVPYPFELQKDDTIIATNGKGLLILLREESV